MWLVLSEKLRKRRVQRAGAAVFRGLVDTQVSLLRVPHRKPS